MRRKYWVLWSLVMFDPNYDLTRNNIVIVLMRDFLKLSPWSGGLG